MTANRDQLLSQRPTDRPRKPRPRSSRPLCHTTDQDLFFAYRDQYREFCREFRAASQSFRSGNRRAVFPPYAIPPPLLYLTTE